MPEFLEDFLDDGVRLVEVGGVGGVTLDFVPEGGDFSDGFLGGFVDDEVGEGDVGAFLREFQCDGLVMRATFPSNIPISSAF